MYTPEMIKAYLERIGLAYDPERALDAGYLRDLQYAHCTTVPYENLDIVERIPLKLDAESLYDKIVTRGRGGYCFELNGAFGVLLSSIGWDVTEYLARYLRGETEIPMRRHRVLRVKCGSLSYMCDVGVGQSAPREPLIIQEGLEQTQVSPDGSVKETYRFSRDDFLGWVLSDFHKGEWRRYFSFTTEPQLPIDFEMPSCWCEYSPDSPFTKKISLSLKTPNGRMTVDGNAFRIFEGDNVTETILSVDDLETVIAERFGIRR